MAGEDYTSDGSNWHPTLNLVLDGEVYSFESIQKSDAPKRGLFAKLLDNVTYTKNIVTNWLGTNGTPQAVERPARGRWVVPSGSTDLEVVNGGALQQVDTTQASRDAYYEFYPVTGETITGIKISVVYAGVPHVAMPVLKPSISLLRFDKGEINPVLIGSIVTDPSTNLTDYENPHDVAITGLNETVPSTARYFLAFQSEDGTNESAGYSVTHVFLSTISSGLPPGL